ncbi:pyridoxal phosphate-dependent transferase [Pisolithus marmoratus]|nr:pyridoxal phosphate-dependent transferase [Pisolithus marmoratus]
MPELTMLSVTASRLAQLVEDVRCDVYSETQDADNDARRAEVSRTFFSDTVTGTCSSPLCLDCPPMGVVVPTKEMMEYAIRASLGDDVHHFEPSTACSRITSGLFMPTGTMSNQQPPYSVLCDARAHVYRMEGGGIAFHSGANVIPIFPENGHHLTAPTRVISLENTLNGTVIPQEEIIAISKHAREKGIIMHLDGARLWDVAVATGLSMKELCEPFESVSVCFSKGLGAPIGSCLVGSKEFIAKAKWFRKVFGGGMRQTGYLAASAAYALTHHFPLLPRVHALARRMQEGLEEIGVGILSPAETCMLFYDPSMIGVEYWEVVERAARLPKPICLNGSRLMMHIQTADEAVEDFLGLMRQLKEEKARAGWRGQQGVVPGRGKHRDVHIRCGAGGGPRAGSA